MGLRISSDFPHGNVADVEIALSDEGATVAFAASAHGGPERMWFCFRIERKGWPSVRGPITLLLKHLDTMLGGGDPAKVHPVIRYDGKQWQRLEPGRPAPTDDGRLGAWWKIDAPANHVDVALCYPYGMGDLRTLLEETDGCWHHDPIGLTTRDRPLLRLANDYGSADAPDRPGLYLLARQHAGETPGSWVMDGMLRRFAALGERAPLVWAVPFADPDGVERGDYGKDAFPHDLNRAWGRPPMRHEIMAIQRDARRWADRCRPALMLDLHAPGLGEMTGLYCFMTDCGDAEGGADRIARLKRWTDAFAARLGDLAADNFARIPNYPSRWNAPNATRYFRDTFDLDALSVESSYQAAGAKVLSIDDYRDAGARLADAIVDRIHE